MSQQAYKIFDSNFNSNIYFILDICWDWEGPSDKDAC